MGDNLSLLDLPKAYLQIHVDDDLWKHQVIQLNGTYYYLTRLGFGLNCAPRILSKILETVLSLNDTVREATDNYLDDLLVNEDVASAEFVRLHLQKFGLEAKPPVSLRDGAKVLGLWVEESPDRGLVWRRAAATPSPSAIGSVLTRRQLFSFCGQLVGHHPIAGRLRVACSFIKRISKGQRWDDDVGDVARGMLKELLGELETSDPVGGRWAVASYRGRLCCDASSLAMG